MRVPYFFLIVWLVATGCRDSAYITENELREYVLDPQNGLRITQKVNEVDLEVIYRPADLVIAQQLDGVEDPKLREKICREFVSRSYFLLKISRGGQEIENTYVYNNAAFSSVIDYLSFSVADDIYLVADRDTLPALDAIYTRMFGSATATSVMAVFDENVKKRNGQITICFDDKKLGLGLNRFEFDASDLKKIPTLKLNVK